LVGFIIVKEKPRKRSETPKIGVIFKKSYCESTKNLRNLSWN